MAMYAGIDYINVLAEFKFTYIFFYCIIFILKRYKFLRMCDFAVIKFSECKNCYQDFRFVFVAASQTIAIYFRILYGS